MSDDGGCSGCLLLVWLTVLTVGSCDNTGRIEQQRAELDDHVRARCAQLSEETIDEIFITGMNTPLTQGEDNE